MTDSTIQRNSAPWNDAASNRLDLRRDQLQGPSANELKKIHADNALASGMGGMLTSGAQHQLGELAHAMGGVSGGLAAGLAGIGATMVSLIEGYATSVHEGDQLNEAYRRDAVNQSVLWLSAGVLPADFVRDRNAEYQATGSVPGQGQGPSSRIINELLRTGRFQEARHLAEQQATAGRNIAERLNINSDAALARRLETDPTFAALYRNPDNTAFRLGVQSVIFEAQHPANPSGPNAQNAAGAS